MEIDNPRVLDAMARVPREAFVPAELAHRAYDDTPLPIGHGQTISQPTMVAMMTAALDPHPTAFVLEIGTGSGYQTAVLANLARRVVTVERIPALAATARTVLAALEYGHRVQVRPAGDALGYPEEALYDGILVTAGAPRVPDELVAQLAPGGVLVIPVGPHYEQDLLRVVRDREGDGRATERLGKCRFVPLIGRSAWGVKTGER